jgi:hypothetical protein
MATFPVTWATNRPPHQEAEDVGAASDHAEEGDKQLPAAGAVDRMAPMAASAGRSEVPELPVP